MTSVNSQVVFITGGAHGIGAEVARRLHGKGAKVVLVGRREEELSKAGYNPTNNRRSGNGAAPTPSSGGNGRTR